MGGGDDEDDAGPGADAELRRAAEGLQAELERKTQRMRVIGARCFTPASPPGPEHERLAEAIGEGVVLLGDYGVDGAPGAVIRPGVLEEGLVVVLVVSPPGRPPYLELTTWFTSGEALTTNGRPDEPAGARPVRLVLDRQPGLEPRALIERHRAATRALVARGRAIRRYGLSGNRGSVFHAVDEYLTSLGC